MYKNEYSFRRVFLNNPRAVTDSTLQGRATVETWQNYGQLSIELNNLPLLVAEDYYRGWLWWRNPEFTPLDLGIIPHDGEGFGMTIIPFCPGNVAQSGLQVADIEGLIISHHRKETGYQGSIVLACEFDWIRPVAGAEPPDEGR